MPLETRELDLGVSRLLGAVGVEVIYKSSGLLLLIWLGDLTCQAKGAQVVRPDLEAHVPL